MLSSRPLLLHLIRKERASLLASKPALDLPLTRSDRWLRNAAATFKEIEQLKLSPLTAHQMEAADHLRLYFLLLKSELVTIRRISDLLNFFKSAVKHRSSGKKRAEGNANNLNRRDLWLRERAEQLRKRNPHLSTAAVASQLAKNLRAFQKDGYRPVGQESIRRIIRLRKTKLGTRA